MRLTIWMAMALMTAACNVGAQDATSDVPDEQALSATTISVAERSGRFDAERAERRLGLRSAMARSRRVDLTGDGRPEHVVIAFASTDGTPWSGDILLTVHGDRSEGDWTSFDEEACAEGGAAYDTFACSDETILLSAEVASLPVHELGYHDAATPLQHEQLEALLDAIIEGQPFTASALPSWPNGSLRPDLSDDIVIQSVVSPAIWSALRAQDTPLWCYYDQDQVCVAFADGYEEPLPVITMRRKFYDPVSLLPELLSVSD